MRHMTNDEQPSPTRRSTRPKKTSEHLRGYIVGSGAKGNCGKEYNACKNLLRTFINKQKKEVSRKRPEKLQRKAQSTT